MWQSSVCDALECYVDNGFAVATAIDPIVYSELHSYDRGAEVVMLLYFWNYGGVVER